MQETVNRIAELLKEVKGVDAENGGGYIILAAAPIRDDKKNEEGSSDDTGIVSAIKGRGIDLIPLLVHEFRVNPVLRDMVKHALLMDAMMPSFKSEKKEDEEK